MRQLDLEIVGHARRPGAEHDHAGAEEHRLRNAMGDEDDGLFGLFPDVQQLEVHLLAGKRIERPERFVHQDQLGIVDQRARNRGALLHAAGQLVGELVLVTGEPDQRKEVAGARAARSHGKAEDLRRQQHVVDHAPPFQQQWLLENHADVARRIERLGFGADRDLAGVEGMQTGENLEQGGLAATRRSDQGHQLARLDIECGFGNGEEIRPPRAVDLLHAGKMDERFAHGPSGVRRHASRASRTTSMRSSASTRPYSTMPISVIRMTAMNIAAVSSVTWTCSMR
jgi:hypothetical protein